MKTSRYLILSLMVFCAVTVQAQNQIETNQWMRTELYFGRSIPSGGKVSNAAWRKFVKTHVTPAFPEGSSVIDAKGQWRDSKTGKTISERSKVLVVLYKQQDQEATNQALEKVADAYIKQFHQQSVMRVDQLAKTIFYPVE